MPAVCPLNPSRMSVSCSRSRRQVNGPKAALATVIFAPTLPCTRYQPAKPSTPSPACTATWTLERLLKPTNCLSLTRSTLEKCCASHSTGYSENSSIDSRSILNMKRRARQCVFSFKVYRTINSQRALTHHSGIPFSLTKYDPKDHP